VAVTRKFVDSEGVNWQVYELSAEPAATEAHEGSWLYFFARGETRSLAAYPDDWSLMDWPGLERLCARAQRPERRDAYRPATVAESEGLSGT
jgi:hypothetical protein